MDDEIIIGMGADQFPIYARTKDLSMRSNIELIEKFKKYFENTKLSNYSWFNL